MGRNYVQKKKKKSKGRMVPVCKVRKVPVGRVRKKYGKNLFEDMNWWGSKVPGRKVKK